MCSEDQRHPRSRESRPWRWWAPRSIHYEISDPAKLEGTGKFVDGQALTPEGTFVRLLDCHAMRRLLAVSRRRIQDRQVI
ncbi:MAG: hypothetical protein QOE23_3131 [Pseudonocardiales bacterium]|jgi:hypothetical protein|nr:hypothetical protein [Pseudonocardiales bacterium]